MLSIVEIEGDDNKFYKLRLYAILAQIYHKNFIEKFDRYLEINASSISKLNQEAFEDYPRNATLCQLPSFDKFIKDHRELLTSAKGWYAKFMDLLKGECLLTEQMFCIEKILWHAAECLAILAEYIGLQTYRYFDDEDKDKKIAKIQLQQHNDRCSSLEYLKTSF